MLKTFVASIVALVTLFISSVPALAGVKLTLKPEYNFETEETQYTLGLPVYLRLASPVAYSGWIGYGIRENADDNWVKADQAIETYYGALALAIGGTIEVVPARNLEEKTIYGKVSWTIVE